MSLTVCLSLCLSHCLSHCVSLQLLRGERRVSEQLPPAGWAPFTDAWLAAHPAAGEAEGFTFSTKEAQTRCDYVMARGGQLMVVDAVRSGGWEEGSPVAPSDHLAVAATLRFEPGCTAVDVCRHVEEREAGRSVGGGVVGARD
jgi:hypothetical protein